ncbi:MAG: hypothetical protein ACE5IR_20425 [bacterium]
MATSEHLADSILIERQGVHALVWDDKGDLIRALLILLEVIDKIPIKPFLLSSVEESEKALRKLFEIQPVSANDVYLDDAIKTSRDELLLIFLQQATNTTIGPLLNGWRSALAKPPGTLLVVRNADFTSFQREAPDLASFIGPKITDSSTILYIWSQKTAQKIQRQLPQTITNMLKKLPGEQPATKEISDWITQHPPLD